MSDNTISEQIRTVRNEIAKLNSDLSTVKLDLEIPAALARQAREGRGNHVGTETVTATLRDDSVPPADEIAEGVLTAADLLEMQNSDRSPAEYVREKHGVDPAEAESEAALASAIAEESDR